MRPIIVVNAKMPSSIIVQEECKLITFICNIKKKKTHNYLWSKPDFQWKKSNSRHKITRSSKFVKYASTLVHWSLLERIDNKNCSYFDLRKRLEQI